MQVVVLASSILSTENVLRSLPVQRLRRNTLFVDVLSVKVWALPCQAGAVWLLGWSAEQQGIEPRQEQAAIAAGSEGATDCPYLTAVWLAPHIAAGLSKAALPRPLTA